MPDIARAKGAAAVVFQTIDRVPAIDALEGTGISSGAKGSKKLRGRISFKKVSFAYPQRPDTHVIKKFDLEIKPGKTIALGAQD
jgi:ATP-binding cassette, subfamily B (MDR/TAP), member 1